ncbi:uncharacterized protein LOC124152186 [Haliotis rufescens]|uniref:uncharacterized protein LOC124152186 n=1 Tax=Haliotis rufescens TaxID=6454 RepID=UPI00201EA55A|nr:uncharacterized protein LOC124152186 [Haliotis rufescens]
MAEKRPAYEAMSFALIKWTFILQAVTAHGQQKELQCGEPGPAPNTHLQLEDGGRTLHYACFYTYTHLSGTLTRRCDKGNLTGEAPVCQLDCGSPLITDRAVSFTSPYTTAGSTATYTCPGGTANAKSTSLCDPVRGEWADADKCHGKLTLTDIHNITQSSLALRHDVITSNSETSSSTSVSDKALYGAYNAIDPMDGMYLAQSHCSSTAAEHKPNVIIALKAVFDVLRVVITLPNDTYAYTLDNFWVYVSPLSSGAGWTFCGRRNRRLEPGTTIMFTCSHKRVFLGRRIKLHTEFPPDRKGMLQLCDVQIYAATPSVDCGKPTPVYKLAVPVPPVTTGRGSTCNYTCEGGFTRIGGSGHSVCEQGGYWSKPTLLCTDEINYAYGNKSWMAASRDASIPTTVAHNITDKDRSTCHLVTQTTSVLFTIDFEQLVEVSDISLVIPDVYSVGAKIILSVTRDTADKKTCKEWSPGEDALGVTHFDCLQHPVGRYLLVEASFRAPRDFRLCDVWVGGRSFVRPYECFTDYGYKGTVNVTVMGIPCKHWDAQQLNTFSYDLPDYSLTEAGNQCRSTSDRTAPWCYTEDPGVRWQYCPVVNCESMCTATEKGVLYNGNIRHSSTGSACVVWGSDDLAIKQETLFPRSNPWTRSCRNPGASQSKPWCYTKSDGTDYGHCDVPACGGASMTPYRHWTVNETHDFDGLPGVKECFVWNNFFNGRAYDGSRWAAKTPHHFPGVPSKEEVCWKGHAYNATMACWEYVREEAHTIILGVVECVSCGDPPVINNSNVTGLTSHYPGGEARYNCLPGYARISGRRLIKCQKDGEWTVSHLNCSADCGQPPPVDNAATTVTGTTENHTAVYTCTAGFMSLHGNTTSSSICLRNGSWEHPDINCTVQTAQSVGVTDSPTANQSVNPTSNQLVVPSSDQPVNPTPSQSVNPTSNQLVVPSSDQSVNPTPSQSVNPTSNQLVVPSSDQSVNPTPSQSVNPTAGQSVNPTPSQSVNPTPSQSVNPSSIQSVIPTTDQSVNQTHSQSVNPTVSQSVNPTPSQSINPTLSQSVNQTPSQSVNQTPSQSVNPTTDQSVNPTAIQSVIQTTDQSVNQTHSQSVNQTPSQSVNPTFIQSVIPTTDQSVNQTHSQSVNQTHSQSVNPTTDQSVNPTPSQSVNPTSSHSDLGSSIVTSASTALSTTSTPTHTTTATVITVDRYGRTRQRTCVCRCVDFRRRNLTLEQRLTDLRVGVEKKNMYILRHKKISAPDPRVSSMGVGAMGILLMVFLFGALLIPDVISLVQYGLRRGQVVDAMS